MNYSSGGASSAQVYSSNAPLIQQQHQRASPPSPPPNSNAQPTSVPPGMHVDSSNLHTPVPKFLGSNEPALSYLKSEPPDTPEPLREQDRFLPIANVSRIMKSAVPRSGKIAKDAKECVQECLSEFISFITSEASDKCSTEKRKTINGEDLICAMQTLGFDSYVEPLSIYLQKYRESIKGEKLAGSPVSCSASLSSSFSASPGPQNGAGGGASAAVVVPVTCQGQGQGQGQYVTVTLGGSSAAGVGGEDMYDTTDHFTQQSNQDSSTYDLNIPQVNQQSSNNAMMNPGGGNAPDQHLTTPSQRQQDQHNDSNIVWAYE